MALLVSTSSGKAAFPAETQWAQLLSQAKVQRQGTINKGPLFFKREFSKSVCVYGGVFGI